MVVSGNSKKAGVVCTTCQDAKGEVKVLKAGGKGAHDQPGGSQEASQDHRDAEGQSVPNEAAKRSCQDSKSQALEMDIQCICHRDHTR